MFPAIMPWPMTGLKRVWKVRTLKFFFLHRQCLTLAALALVALVALATLVALITLVALVALAALAALALAIVPLAVLALVALAIALALCHHPIIHVNCDHM